MFFSRANYAHPAFRAGLRDMWPQAPGVAAWGLMTGVAMVESGMSTLEAVLMTLLVYAAVRSSRRSRCWLREPRSG